MARSTFRRGRATFVCEVCGRRTRETEQPMDCNICFECWEIAGWDNHVNDNGADQRAEVMPEVERLLKIIVERGGDAAKVRAENPYIWPN